MRTQAGELNKDVTQDNSMLEEFTERPKTAKGKNEGYYIVTLVLLAQAKPSTGLCGSGSQMVGHSPKVGHGSILNGPQVTCEHVRFVKN